MATNILDIRKEHCPMTFVKTKIALEKLNKGEKLTVLLTKGEPLENLPKSATEQGYKVIEITSIEQNSYKVVIEK